MYNRLAVSESLHRSNAKPQLLAPSFQHTPRPLRSVPVCFCGPERYEPRYQYPLIVWLHSCHSSERELECVMRDLSLQNYVACAPRGTVASEACGKRFSWGQSPTAVAVAEECVFGAIDAAMAQFSVAPQKIFLAGFGGGGSMAWRIALRYPSEFAGVVAINGNFPQNHVPLANLVAARNLPTLWMHGCESEHCGIEQVCQALPVMHAARLSVHVRQYPCGHELLRNMLVDMNGWLMELVTNQSTNLDAHAEESFSRN